MSKPINTTTLAYNAARAKKALINQEELVKKLSTQLIERVGTGGETIKTNLGVVTVTAQTESRPSGKTILQFDEEMFNMIKPEEQARLITLGVVKMVPTQIAGQAPRVQFRLS